MDIIIGLSDLPLIRRRLTDFLPHRPSSLAEAFAAGLGHASHAAALASIAAAADGRDPWHAVHFDPESFAARLTDGRRGAAEAATIALRTCGVVKDGPGVEERADDAVYKINKRSRGPVEEFTKSGLREVEKFSLMTGTLDSQMDKTCWLLDWYQRSGQPFGLRLNRRIAASCQLHADLDPDMARFVSDAMAALDRIELDREGSGPEGELRDDPCRESAFASCAWMDDVYMAFQPRILRFFDKIARCWDGSHDPLLLEPDWKPLPAGPEPTTRPRHPGITVGFTPHARTCRFDRADTGSADTDIIATRGLTAFAMWRSGAPETQLHAFGAEARRCHFEHPADLVGRWVNLDGNGGSQASRAALLDACWPGGLRGNPALEGKPTPRDAGRDQESRRPDRPTPARRHVIDDRELLTVLSDPPSVAALCSMPGECVECLELSSSGGSVLIRTAGGRFRDLAAPADVVADAMRAWLDWPRDDTAVMGVRESLGEANAYLDLPTFRVRLAFHETDEYACLHTRMCGKVPPSPGDEDGRAAVGDKNPAASILVAVFNALDAATRVLRDKSRAGLPREEFEVLMRRNLVLSAVSHRRYVRAAENLVERGLMQQIQEPNHGYGRRRFQATRAGLRLLVGARRASDEARGPTPGLP